MSEPSKYRVGGRFLLRCCNAMVIDENIFSHETRCLNCGMRVHKFHSTDRGKLGIELLPRDLKRERISNFFLT